MFFKVVYGPEIHVMNCKEQISISKLEAFIMSVFKKLPKKYTLTYRDSDDDVISIVNDGDLKILGESGLQKVRIEIQEVSEDFYDQTQEIYIEEIPKEEEMLPVEPIKESNDSRLEVESCSDLKSIDDSISEKLAKLMPEIISKVKQEVIEENKIRESQIKTSSTQSKIIDAPAVHERYICDGCGANPIIGNRYKCVVCSDFDLCEKCEAASNHEHAFLKIKNPKQAPLKIFCIVDDQEDSLECNGQRMNLPPLNMGFDILRNILGHGQQQMTEETKQTFKKCKNQFKDVAKTFMEQIKKNNEAFMKQAQTKTEEKVEEKKSEQKVEEVEVKVEVPVVEEKAEDKNQPIIIVDNEEKPREEAPKVEPAVVEISQEETQLDAANYLCDIVGIDFKPAMRYAKKFPILTKEEILMNYCNGL